MNDDISTTKNEGDWYIYIGTAEPIPFGATCRCLVSYPNGSPKGPIFVSVLEVATVPDFDTDREPLKYAAKRDMLGDWVPSHEPTPFAIFSAS